ncbi:TetR family transcriptional regulator [Embleya scabrispora]|uniref:TetR family transcriptional regulator n=1 Tax=Embleya scabrispora TaxID=159449 RepID=UPI00035C77C0|nr:TetR family transcriptional regulator [Embleya scabrispora]MYS81499.1 TetR family transcriptional regulator [Streptomyces sp. SID5474]
MHGPAGDSKAPTGLRERKKARTRQVISSVAFDLFEEQGFEQTTIEQICRRSEVAHRTFFRYFPTKESLLFGWDFGNLILDGFAAAPADLDLVSALEYAMTVSQGNLEEQAEQTTRRQALRRRFMDIRAVHDHGVALIDLVNQRMVSTAAARLGVDPREDLRPHALGALVAAMTRRRVIDGVDPGSMALWADAFRTLLPAPTDG